MVLITKTTRASLVRQVDAQLAGAVGPVRGFGVGRAHDQIGPDVERIDRLSSVYIAALRGAEVVVIAAPRLRGEDTPLPAMKAAQLVAAARTGRAFTVESADGDLRYRARAYVDRAGIVVLALPIDSVDEAIADLITVELLAAGVIAVALGLVGWWVIHLGVRPVKRMTSVATAIAGGDLSQRVPDADTRTEAGQLGAALNAMLGRIEAAFDERTRADTRLRQFVADASHELRTPVATIRGYAELYRAGGLPDRTALDDAMRRTEQEAIRMGSLVDDLLQLARLDQGRPLERDTVDLAAITEDAARDARAVDHDRTVRVEVESPLLVVGDESRLRQVLANIVGNALVHTPSDAAIELRAMAREGRAVVEISDEGPGMPAEVAARATERFFRADVARSRHQGGSGLGLAIVDATVRAHGGAMRIDSAVGRGTTVSIELPLGEAQGER